MFLSVRSLLGNAEFVLAADYEFTDPIFPAVWSVGYKYETKEEKLQLYHT